MSLKYTGGMNNTIWILGRKYAFAEKDCLTRFVITTVINGNVITSLISHLGLIQSIKLNSEHFWPLMNL